MKILEQKQNLDKHLDIVEKALPGKTTKDILKNIYFECNGEEISFLATNLEVGIKSVYEKPVEEQGKLLLPPRFIDIIKNLPPGEIEIDLDMENYWVEINTGNSLFKLAGMPPDEYPYFKEATPDREPMVFTGSELKQIIKRAIFAVSHDESRPAFTGMLFSIKEDKLQITASDTYRLVVEEIPDKSWDYEEGEFLIPARSLRELIKLLGDGDEVQVFPYENQLAFAFNRVFFFSRLIESKFPEVKGVIPSETVAKSLVDREGLEKAIQRASLLVDPNTQAVQMQLNAEEMGIKVNSSLGSMEEKIFPQDHQGEEISIYLNVRFLQDVIKVLESERLEMQFSGSEAPCILRPENKEGYLYLVLPIKME